MKRAANTLSAAMKEQRSLEFELLLPWLSDWQRRKLEIILRLNGLAYALATARAWAGEEATE